MERLPTVDLAPLLEGTPGGLVTTARAIGAACRDVGFFSVVNHGIPNDLIAQTFAAGASFFALGPEQKDRVAATRSEHYRGYVAPAGEQLDPAHPGDAKESFNIGRELAPDDPGLLRGEPFHGPNQWPDVPGFRSTMLAYFAALQTLATRMHAAFAIDLGFEAGYFDASIDRPLALLRLLHYPPHPGRFDGTLYGAAPHTDYGNLTLLAQDDRGGLEVRDRSGGWIAVTPVAGAFVCNIGDALALWSRGAYVSTPHRVVNRSGRERASIAFFFDPNADASLGDRTFADYLRARYAATYTPAQAPATLKT